MLLRSLMLSILLWMSCSAQAQAATPYGAGAILKDQSMGNGYCAFVYQRPGEGYYILGSDNNLETAIDEKDNLVRNQKVLIHHEVVCPDN